MENLLFILLVILTFFARKAIITNIMRIYGIISGNLTNLSSLKFLNYKIIKYQFGGLMKQCDFKINCSSKSNISLYYELGDGLETKEFIKFAEITADENGEFHFSIFLGTDPCRIIMTSDDGTLGKLEETKVAILKTNVFKANFLQKFGYKKSYDHFRIINGSVIQPN